MGTYQISPKLRQLPNLLKDMFITKNYDMVVCIYKRYKNYKMLE